MSERVRERERASERMSEWQEQVQGRSVCGSGSESVCKLPV